MIFLFMSFYCWRIAKFISIWIGRGRELKYLIASKTDLLKSKQRVQHTLREIFKLRDAE